MLGKFGSKSRVSWAIAWAFGSSMLPGCLAPGASGGATIKASSATTSTDASESGDIYLRIETKPESAGDDLYVSRGTCAIPSGSAPTSKSCIFKVPEDILHYSKVRFVFGTSSKTVCSRVTFIPYFYVASNEAGFVPYWQGDSATTADCNVLGASGYPSSHDCYYGAAPLLYSDFPATVGTYILPAFTQENNSLVLESQNNLNITNGRLIAQDINLNACNKNDTPAVSLRFAAGYSVTALQNELLYLGSSMQDYMVTCVDEYDETIHTLSVKLGDIDNTAGENPADPTIDDYYDWGESL